MARRPLGSRYTLDREIGRGAMGSVWSGNRNDDDRLVAVKLLRSEYAEDPDIVHRFVQERSFLTRVVHPNVVRVHDLVVEGNTLGIVMEHVGGGDLKELLDARGTLPPAEAAWFGQQIALGLSAIHAGGVVHRDVKPANVLIHRRDGVVQPKVSDFGVARVTQTLHATTSTAMLGTPLYMAPEIIEEEPPSAASDVYSLGILLYQMLVGVTPFAGPGGTYGLLRRHSENLPGRPAGIPDGLWTVVERMLAKEAVDRPTAEDVAEELGHLVEELASLPALPPLGEPPAGGRATPRRLPPDEAHTVQLGAAGSTPPAGTSPDGVTRQVRPDLLAAPPPSSTRLFGPDRPGPGSGPSPGSSPGSSPGPSPGSSADPGRVPTAPHGGGYAAGGPGAPATGYPGTAHPSSAYPSSAPAAQMQQAAGRPGPSGGGMHQGWSAGSPGGSPATVAPAGQAGPSGPWGPGQGPAPSTPWAGSPATAAPGSGATGGRRRRWTAGRVVGLVVGAVLLAVGLLVLIGILVGEPEMPEVVGLREAQAEELLGTRVDVTRTAVLSDGDPVGTVVGQHPAPGEPRGREVEIEVAVPSVITYARDLDRVDGSLTRDALHVDGVSYPFAMHTGRWGSDGAASWELGGHQEIFRTVVGRLPGEDLDPEEQAEWDARRVRVQVYADGALLQTGEVTVEDTMTVDLDVTGVSVLEVRYVSLDGGSAATWLGDPRVITAPENLPDPDDG